MRIVVAVLCLLLAACSKAPPAYESRYTTPPSPTPAARTTFDVTAVNNTLAGPQPYAISVLGDSTGNAANEWVHLIGQRIATTYGRQVTVHDWNLDAGKYDKDTVYGEGAPVTVWNASGSGKPAEWSLQNFNTQVPEPVNLTIINHGHNSPKTAVASIGDLVQAAYNKGTGGVVVLLQNPRADDPARAQLEADTYTQIGQKFNNPAQGTIVVDVFNVFPTGDALLGMLNRDRVHPNDAGEQLWADTVWAGLQLR